MLIKANTTNTVKAQDSGNRSMLRPAHAFIFALCLLLNSEAHAGNKVGSYFVNATKLATICRRVEAAQQAICKAYIAGIYDALSATNDIFDDRRKIIGCIDKHISIDDVRNAFIIEYKREIGNLPASRVVIDGLTLHVCIDSEKLDERIKKELGPVPKNGTEDARRYYMLYSCMSKLNTSKAKCEKLLGGKSD